MEITLEITDLSRSGTGVGRDASGKVIFVPFTAPGDIVRVQVESEDKRYSEGKVLEILQASPQRIAPKCPVFGRCGGCDWQHLPYEMQWQTKIKGLKHTLQRLGMECGDLPWNEFPADNPWEYRNRIQLRGSGSELGFYERKSKRLVNLEKCWIARPELNDLLASVREEGRSKPREYKVELEVFPDGKTTATWNAGHSAQGFRQVFDAQNHKLQNWVSDQLHGTGVLLDLYGGSGNLSLNISDRFQEIHCVDVGSPLRDPLEMPHFHFHRAPVLPWLRKQNFSRPVSVVLDPPREGLGEDLIPILEVLKKLPAQEILAVGCEADPWARMLHRLDRHGWKIESLGALDFFPQTHHVEALAVLRLK